MYIYSNSQMFLECLLQVYPWARFVSRSRKGFLGSPGALRIHELMPEPVNAGGFTPVGRYEDLPTELLAEVKVGTVVEIKTLLEELSSP